MHYTIMETPGPANVIPASAVGKFSLCSYSRNNLNKVIEIFKKIIQGAALIANVDYEIDEGDYLANKIPVLKLNDLLMKNAELCGAPRITPPREKTGSTDFINIMYMIPDSCIRTAFVSIGVSSHTDEFAAAGKTEAAHNCITYASKTLAGVTYDIISNPDTIKAIQEEFKVNKELHM